MPYVRSEAVVNLANVVRASPSVRAHVLPSLSKCLRRVDDPTARAALIWMLGEYGEEVLEAPYMLEPIIGSYEDEQSALVKLHALTAAMKLFFKRPPEMQNMLGRLLSFAVNDSSNQDVHDRALLYYRLLSADVSAASSLFQPHATSVTGVGFAENRDNEKKNLIFAEFNTLAVVFGMPSAKFIDEKYQLVSMRFVLIFVM